MPYSIISQQYVLTYKSCGISLKLFLTKLIANIDSGLTTFAHNDSDRLTWTDLLHTFSICCDAFLFKNECGPPIPINLVVVQNTLSQRKRIQEYHHFLTTCRFTMFSSCWARSAVVGVDVDVPSPSDWARGETEAPIMRTTPTTRATHTHHQRKN